MATAAKFRFSISTMLLVVLCLSFFLGWVQFAGLFYGMLASVVLHFVLYLGTKSKAWRNSALCQIALFIAFWILMLIESIEHGPYTQYFNHSIYRKAMAAGLVGADEQRVEQVLGSASSCYSGWDSTYFDSGLDSGKPTPNARFGTTYNYSPLLPFGKFQVHCEDGKVISLEMFDD